eukprot:3769859-Alexandrium_andersonii.AAC.1
MCLDDTARTLRRRIRKFGAGERGRWPRPELHTRGQESVRGCESWRTHATMQTGPRSTTLT